MAPSSLVRTYRLLWRHGLAPTLKHSQSLSRPARYLRYWRDWRTYRQLPGAESLSILDSFPQIDDWTVATGIDAHYFYQSVWAARLIGRNHPSLHVDIGSDHRLVGMLTSITRIVFADIRPLEMGVVDLLPVAGSILELPFGTNSLASLSCLHVAEHVGLGRYGDPLNPDGTREAATELSRVLAPGGDLYFSIPVGRPRVEFNAHRIHTPDQIVAYFPGLELKSFSAEDDGGTFRERAELAQLAAADYACGMFYFFKRA
jgi:hypothetical protein